MHAGNATAGIPVKPGPKLALATARSPHPLNRLGFLALVLGTVSSGTPSCNRRVLLEAQDLGDAAANPDGRSPLAKMDARTGDVSGPACKPGQVPLQPLWACARAGTPPPPVVCGPKPDCSIIACDCNNKSFFRCKDPTWYFASEGLCPDDAKCLGLDITECRAATDCAVVSGVKPSDYCLNESDPGPRKYIGCRGANVACGLAITWSQSPTGEVLVFGSTCVPLGWSKFGEYSGPSRCP